MIIQAGPNKPFDRPGLFIFLVVLVGVVLILIAGCAPMSRYPVCTNVGRIQTGEGAELTSVSFFNRAYRPCLRICRNGTFDWVDARVCGLGVAEDRPEERK